MSHAKTTIKRAVKGVGAMLGRALPGVLRAHEFSADLVLRGRRLLDVRPPRDGARALGAAFDGFARKLP